MGDWSSVMSFAFKMLFCMVKGYSNRVGENIEPEICQKQDASS